MHDNVHEGRGGVQKSSLQAPVRTTREVVKIKKRSFSRFHCEKFKCKKCHRDHVSTNDITENT